MGGHPLIKNITHQLEGLDVRISNQVGTGHNQGRHYHEHANLVFIMDGGCVEKRKHNSREREASDLAFLHAGVAHETIFTGLCNHYISLDIKPEVFAESGFDENAIFNTVGKCPDAKFLILKIYAELLCNDDLSSDSIKMLFLEFASLSRVVGRIKTPPAWVSIVNDLLNDRWAETS